jgi:hypothetical protein
VSASHRSDMPASRAAIMSEQSVLPPRTFIDHVGAVR